MWRFRRFAGILLGLGLVVANCSAAVPLMLRADGYIITSEEDAASEQWAEYLFAHLSKRAVDKSLVMFKTGGQLKAIPAGFKSIHIEVATDLDRDYSITHTPDRVQIRMRSKEVALWMTYQLIGKIGEDDPRFAVADLPPSVIDFSDQDKTFDFAYREPFYAPNLTPEYAPIIGTNNVESDWGLWGHNLSRIVKEADHEDLFAQVDGKRNKAQISFSSPELLTLLSNHIIDNCGRGEKHAYRFMIMPNDNDIVCACPACVALGNTRQNATPAVIDLISKLAKQFPKHQFFTTAYRTTTTPPVSPMPKNTGVFFSTIDLPKGIAPNPKQKKTQQFISKIEAWKRMTPNIYVWDYAANFDDYLTPIPTLLSLKKQWAFFKALGVKGVFLNAGGYDYMPFDDVKTFVSAALMMDTEVDVDKLCGDFFKKEYPISHDLLAKYYLTLEHRYFEKRKAYDMYGGMRSNLTTYLDADKFVDFYEALKQILPGTRDEEKQKLTKLLTALTYTRLQIAYVNGLDKWGYATREGNTITIKPEMRELLETLENYKKFPDLKNYKETEGALADYIAEWKQLMGKGIAVNALTAPVKVFSTPDEGFEESTLLNDGTPGFTLDYHQGWYLSSTDDLRVGFSTADVPLMQQIKLRFLNMEQHGIYPPVRIDIYVDGELARSVSSRQIKKTGGLAECTIPLQVAGSKDIQLKMIRRQARKSIIACDEVLVLN